MNRHVLHLLSDSTGETATAAANAVLSQFENPDITLRMHVFVRSAADIDAAVKAIRKEPGPVVYTLLDSKLSDRLVTGVDDLGVETIPLLNPLFKAVRDRLGAPRRNRPGKQYQIDAKYFGRVAAIDYAMALDDGATADRLRKADVILLGVSRTSKTPTCLYLAVRGVKAANVPLVPGAPLPPGLDDALAAGVPAVGLTASPTRLAQIRTQRLEVIGSEKGIDYAELPRVREEVSEALMTFERLGIPTIDVTRRSIEETAASIMALMRDDLDATERGENPEGAA
ncbi:pyruvate, water dikinase regulatory protein [Rhodovulum sp. DZ06]|uniref:pyruvate, water dikinase regulatory protein n=1 Tax=Rhodovulum sp. DZ06 TaxID=3425126 RepID=UPI003D32ADEA